MARQEIRTRDSRIRLEADGIYRVAFDPVADTTLADTYEAFAAFLQLGARRKRPLLCDVRNLRGLSNESREFWMTGAAANLFSASAMVVEAGGAREDADFFAEKLAEAMPIRVFTSEEEALDWLRGFIDEK